MNWIDEIDSDEFDEGVEVNPERKIKCPTTI